MNRTPDAQCWDIFCRVVDNFGDAGVSWRLARLLRRQHDLPVRLWIDRIDTLAALHPDIDAGSALQVCEGVTVCRWPGGGEAARPGAVVIEAFGCGLPEQWPDAMAAMPQPPLWIVLEYLSAEAWVSSHHGLPSPHPRLSLPRHFFFPGFAAGTGGLLREPDLLRRREAFDMQARARFWRDLGFTDGAALTLSMFAYPYAPLGALLGALAAADEPVAVAVPAGGLLPAVAAFFGAAGVKPGDLLRRGALELRVLPFLPQSRYDELLWACDWNFVRGEDSFVRAQWAARPLLWQPYRQEAGTHEAKLAAFAERYCEGMEPRSAAALRAFWQDWSGDGGGIAASWRALRACRGELEGHARRWAGGLAGVRELSAQLVEFARDRVK